MEKKAVASLARDLVCGQAIVALRGDELVGIAGMRLRTRRVTCWRNGKLILRWAATAYLETEKHFRRIMGYKFLWVLEAALAEEEVAEKQTQTQEVAVAGGGQPRPTRLLQAAAA